MELLVVRHAIAATGDDDARPLTDEGRRRFAPVVEVLARNGPTVEVVLHSPKLRAIQTAELLIPLCAATEVTRLLAASPDDALLERLRRLDGAAVVGHSPWLEELVGLLVAGERAAGARQFSLRKGGIAWLTGEARSGGMQLRALLTPRLVRR